MKHRKSIYSAVTAIITGIIIAIYPVQLLAQQAEFPLSGGSALVVQGDDFVFEQVLSTVDGEEILQERAIWEGGITVVMDSDQGRFTLSTGHIELVFDGANVSTLEAGPEVEFVALEGRATFSCDDVFIDFPTMATEGGIYRGRCTNVHGYYLADATELGLEGDETYEVNFTADVMRLGPDNAVLERPALSLGNIDDPELAVRSREISFVIGPHPITGERDLLGARLANLTLDVYGISLHVLPFPLWRGLVHRDEPGWNIAIPRVGWGNEDYLRLDFRPTYDFMLPGFSEGPQVTFRLDAFPFMRSYPEIIGRAGFEDFYMEARTGYRRGEDADYHPVPVRAEPEITVGTEQIQLGDSGFIFDASTFWGHLRDMRAGPDLDRWGWRAGLSHPDIMLGEVRLSGTVDFFDYYYQGGSNYTILDGKVRLRYVDPPNWGASLTYERVFDWGETPFLFDRPQVTEALGLREQSRFSRRWGAGFDWAWDFADDDFERQECHLTYILDSLQVSAGWDFFDETVTVRFDLPGSLR